MKTVNTRYEKLVHDIVADVLGGAHPQLEPVPTYPDSIVYRGSGVVFKAVDPDGHDPDRIALEAWAIERAGARGVPVPAVLALDASAARFPSTYVVMTEAAGVPFDALDLSPADRARVLRRIGDVLAQLHDEEVPRGFGWLDEDHFRGTGEVRGAHESWRRALLADVPDALAYLAAHVQDADELAAAARAVDVAEPRRACLLHGDFGGNHIWIDPASLDVACVIDFGERAAGDWLWDLTEIEPRDLGAVLDGYGVPDAARGDVERRFWEYALLKAIPWAAKWHRRGEPQVLDWLATCLERVATRPT